MNLRYSEFALKNLCVGYVQEIIYCLLPVIYYLYIIYFYLLTFALRTRDMQLNTYVKNTKIYTTVC